MLARGQGQRKLACLNISGADQAAAFATTSSFMVHARPDGDRTDTSWKPSLAARLRPALPLAALCFIIWFVCFSNLNAVGLIDLVDEGLYAAAARQMVDSGDWVTPRVGPNIFLDKPPLAYWCQAFFIRFLGPTPAAARLPSAIAAALTALALYFWASRRGVTRVGWLAAVLYLLCPLVGSGLARVAMVDSLLTLWLTLAIIGWVEGYGGNRKGYLLMAGAMGLATMTKGLIGFLLPGAVVIVWLLIRRDFGELRKVPWVAAFGIFMLVVLPWHLAAWRANGGFFLDEYVGRQHIHRFLGKDFGHNAPFWYYLPVLLAAMFPWGLLVPAAWRAGLRAWRSEKGSLDCALGMWALWAVTVFVFFSISWSKLPNYILPALPALTLLIAIRLDSLWERRHGLPLFDWISLWVPGILLGATFLTLGVFGRQWLSQPAPAPWLARSMGKLLNWKEQTQGVDVLWRKLTVITDLVPYWITLGSFLLLGSLLILVWRKSTPKAVASAAAMSLALIAVVWHFGLPAWGNDEVAPVTNLGRRALPALERGEPLVIFALHPKRPSLRYTLRHNSQIIETFSPDALQVILRDAGNGYVLTGRDTALPTLPGTFQQEAAEGRWALWRYQNSF